MAGRKNSKRNAGSAKRISKASRYWEKYHAAKAAKGLKGVVDADEHPDVIIWAYRARRAAKLARGQDASDLDAAIRKLANHHLKKGDRASYVPLPGVFGTIVAVKKGDTYDIRWAQTGAIQRGIDGSKLKKAAKAK